MIVQLCFRISHRRVNQVKKCIHCFLDSHGDILPSRVWVTTSVCYLSLVTQDDDGSAFKDVLLHPNIQIKYSVDATFNTRKTTIWPNIQFSFLWPKILSRQNLMYFCFTLYAYYWNEKKSKIPWPLEMKGIVNNWVDCFGDSTVHAHSRHADSLGFPLILK